MMKRGKLVLVAFVSVISILLNSSVNVSAETIIGSSKRAFDEGMFKNVYWTNLIEGSGGCCWIRFCYGKKTSLKTTLTIELSTGDFVVTDRKTYMNKTVGTKCETKWQTNGLYCARKASGNGYVNSDYVNGVYVEGWW